MTTTQTIPQHLRALELANSIRLARAGIKRDIAAAPSRRDGLALVAELLAYEPAPVLQGMLVTDLLAAVPRVSERMAVKWAAFAQLRRMRIIGELTPGERNRILTFIARKVAP